MTRVLIVDDIPENLYFLEVLLKGNGFEVMTAMNGSEALESALRTPPDLIISDILMPVMDGFSLCREWKADNRLKQIPFIIYTATYTEPKDEKFALSLGADRFIVKPQELETLLQIMAELLKEKYSTKPSSTKPLGEEMEFFRGHNEILFSKLEKKMMDLEIANRKLKTLEESYRLSFENVSDVIYTIDTDLTVLSLSPSVERILGYNPQDLLGRQVSELGHIVTQESLERITADLSLILKGDTISATIYEFIAKDGTIKFGEVSGSPILQDGQITGVISVARDITERKQSEAALKESEKKYRELYDFLPIPIYEMDLEAKITSANRAIFETFKGTEEDLKKGFNAWQLLSPEEVEKSAKNIERLLKGDKVQGTEYSLRRLDGSVFPAIVISSVIYNQGNPAGLRGAIIDITERKRMEETVKVSMTKYQTLFDTLPLGVTISDKTGRILESNKAAEVLLGLPHEEQTQRTINGREWHIIQPDGSPLPADEYASVRALKENRIVQNVEMGLVKKEGEVTWLNVTAAPIPLEDYGVVIAYNDITERMQGEEALRQSMERLRKATNGIIDVIALSVESRDPYTAGHQRRVSSLACAIAQEIDLPSHTLDNIRMAGIIHDIGKISVPAEILSKPTKLTEIEFSLIKIHPQSGYNILKEVELPYPIAEIVLQHHERLNGSGYPQGLQGDQILLETNIIAVADVVEAISSHRPYRPARGIDTALEEIERNKDILYDPEVVEVCLRLFREKAFRF